MSEGLTPRSTQAECDAVLDAFPDGVLIVDGAGRVLYANRAAQRLLGPAVGGALPFALPEAGALVLCGVGAEAALVVVRANDAERQAHEQRLAALDKASGGKTVWRGLEASA